MTKIEQIPCIECGHMFWATEAYLKAGKPLLCELCDDPEPLLLEDDTSEEFDFKEPEPMQELV